MLILRMRHNLLYQKHEWSHSSYSHNSSLQHRLHQLSSYLVHLVVEDTAVMAPVDIAVSEGTVAEEQIAVDMPPMVHSDWREPEEDRRDSCGLP